MTARARAVVLLAEALFDLLHLPETSTGAMLRRSTLRGEVPSRLVACPDCSGGRSPELGWRVDRFKRRQPCLTCGGRPEREGARGRRLRARGGRGVVKVDGYTGRIVGSELTDAPGRVESWLCNVCHGRGVEPKRPGSPCRACGGRGQREFSPFVLAGADPDRRGDPETVLEDAIRRRDESGSFHELELCLAELKRRFQHLWLPFHQVHVVKTRAAAELSERERRWLADATVALAALMPPEIRVPGYLVAADRNRRKQLGRARGRHTHSRVIAERNREMRRLFAAGERSVAELVRDFNVSRSTVYEAIHEASA